MPSGTSETIVVIHRLFIKPLVELMSGTVLLSSICLLVLATVCLLHEHLRFTFSALRPVGG